MAEQRQNTLPELMTSIAERQYRTAGAETRSGTLASVAVANNARTMRRLAETGQRIESTESAINDALVKRASILERLALARERGDSRSEFLMRKQLENLDGQMQLIKSVNELEVRQNALFAARQRHQRVIAEAQQRGHAVSEQVQETVRQNLEDIVKISEEYDAQRRTLQRVAAGVMDVREAHRQVADEIEREQTAITARERLASMSRREQLDATLNSTFGEGWDNMKKDLQSKAAIFLKVGAAAALIGTALKDMSHDSDEVVNSLYRMGGSVDRVNNGFLYYASNVVKLNQVQSQLRGTAAAMNMPVEAVEGMTDQIMSQIRVLDKYGSINLKTVAGVANTALTYSRQMGVDAKEALNLMSTLNNKFGYDPTKEIRKGVTELDDQMRGVTAAVITANDQLDDMGKGKANIFIEDVAKIMEEAAQNADGFSLSLKDLGATASLQMKNARELGASYNDALEQAKMLTDFMVKRNDVTNYKIGKNIAGDIKSKHSDLIKAGDVDGLAKAIMAEYKVKDQNEAALVARQIISNGAMTNVTIGRVLGGTEGGQRATGNMLEEAIKKRVASASDTSKIAVTDFEQVAALMDKSTGDADGKAALMINTWLEKAIQAKKEGGLAGLENTHFIGAAGINDSDLYKKNYEQTSAEQVEKASPLTPTSMKNTLEAVFKSPFNQLILGVLALGSAVSVQIGAAAVFSGRQIGVLQQIKLLLASGGRDRNGNAYTPETLTDEARDQARSERDRATDSATGIKGMLKRGMRWGTSNPGKVGLTLAATAALGYGAYKLLHTEEKTPEPGDLSARQKLVEEANAENTTQERKAELKKKISDLDAATAERARKDNDTAASAPGGTPEPKEPGSSMFSMGNVIGAGGIAAAAIGASRRGQPASLASGAADALANPATRAAGEAVADTGAHVAGRAATRVGISGAANSIPILGGLISGVVTGAMTEGSMGRKISAGLGDFIGAELGQFLGPIGAIAGGYAGGKAGTGLYDALWGGEEKKPLATATVPATPQPTTSGQSGTAVPMPTTGMTGFGQNAMLPADISLMGQKVMLSIPKASFMSVQGNMANARLANETGVAGIQRGGG